MKKFGTPIGAAPGSAKEKVGLDGVGTPDGVVAGAGLAGAVAGLFWVVGVVDGLGFGLGFGCLLPGEPEPGDGCWEGLVPLPPLGLGGGDGVVVVVVVVLGGGACVVVVVLDDEVDVVLVELVAGGGHDSETVLAGPGRFSEDSGAPGASWK